MAISRYAAATDAIVALARADTTLTTAAVEIVDGPPIQQQYGTTVLYVGWTGDEESDAAGTIQSAYHDLGPAAKRDETCEIRCITRAVRGDDNMSQARADAVAAFKSDQPGAIWPAHQCLSIRGETARQGPARPHRAKARGAAGTGPWASAHPAAAGLRPNGHDH